MTASEPQVLVGAIRDAHEAAIRHGQPSYLDPDTGYVVLTAPTLLARGDCCGNGCRHCPWPEEE